MLQVPDNAQLNKEHEHSTPAQVKDSDSISSDLIQLMDTSPEIKEKIKAYIKENKEKILLEARKDKYQENRDVLVQFSVYSFFITFLLSGLCTLLVSFQPTKFDNAPVKDWLYMFVPIQASIITAVYTHYFNK